MSSFNYGSFHVAIMLSFLGACAPVDDVPRQGVAPWGDNSVEVEFELLGTLGMPEARSTSFRINVNRSSSGGNLCVIEQRAPQGIPPGRTFRCSEPLTWPRAVSEGLLITGEITYLSMMGVESHFDLCQRQLAFNHRVLGAFVPFRLAVRDSLSGNVIPMVLVESNGRCSFELRPPLSL